jgi:ubiquinone/menaquinone biosynthesis C-methylase UbiE
VLRRYLAQQFARPHGLVGRWLIAPWLDRINQGMNELAFELLEARRGDRVLEVGFGGGALLACILERRPAKAIGIDISEEVVARGRSRFRRDIAEGRARILSGSVESLPLGDVSVDAACSLNTIYFWNEPAEAMREVARVLRRGGTLVLGFEAPETLRAWPGHRFGFRVYDAPEVVALAEAAGFGNAQVHEGLEPKFGRIICVKCERL